MIIIFCLYFKIYKFHGCLVDDSGRRTPVGKDNLVLRECILKNTDFVEGVVVYAGHESKAMMNNGGPRHKISKVSFHYRKDAQGLQL